MRPRALTPLVAALLAVLAPVRAACLPATDLTAIEAVQGKTARSPLVGRTVRVQGVVTVRFAGLDGFFLQDPRGDGDPSTSDALFVHGTTGGPAAPSPGDVVQVAGTVRETDGMTQIAAVSALARCGSGAPPVPLSVRLPLPSRSGWEALEGMLVRFPEALTITDVYELGRYGELTLAARRLVAPTQDAGAHAGADRRTVVLDDGSRRQDPRPLPYRLGDGRPPRVGDTVAGLTAVVMGSADGSYRLEPVGRPLVLSANPRPPAPAPVGGDVTVASFNLHNLFTTLHERGARTATERELQRDKLVSALALLNADAIALQEIENDGMRTEEVLLRALNARLGRPVYAAVPDPAGGVGGDLIKQAILYKPSTLALVATASDPRPVFERAPVAATFRRADGSTFTLVAVHLKSKGGCPSAGDVDHGYGCWNLRRSAQAQALLTFAGRLERASGSPDVLVAGDLNSYADEPPVRLLAGAGYRNADTLVPAPSRYSYVYRGLSGTLDYVLASPELAPRLTGAALWHIDADESPLLGSDTPFEAMALVSRGPYRASDHDPVLVGLALGRAPAGP